MAMQYNTSLDMVIAGLVKLSEGKHELAAKAFTKASRDPSFGRCIALLEASNEKAFQKLQASVAQKQRMTAAEEKEDADLEALASMEGGAEMIHDKHPSVAEGEPNDMLEKQARSKDTIAAGVSASAATNRFAQALAALK
jgi:hypothetical protein